MSIGKGKKRLKGQPIIHLEIKKKHGVWLTNTAWEKLKEIAQTNKTSASEILESWIKNYQGT
jgi:hypothetical protein